MEDQASQSQKIKEASLLNLEPPRLREGHFREEYKWIQQSCFKSATVVCPLTTIHFHLFHVPAILTMSQEPQSLIPV